MATPTVAENQGRVFKKIISLLSVGGSVRTATQPAGGGHVNHLRFRTFVCAGTPTGAYIDGMETGDLILDTTNSLVYRAAAEPATGVYVNLTAVA